MSVLDAVHPFKREMVSKLLVDPRFVNNVCEAWVFGSASGNNHKKHSAFSDLDIAVAPKFIDPNNENVDDAACKQISMALYDAAMINGKRISYDIIWLTSSMLQRNPEFVQDQIVSRGVRLV